MCCSLQYGFNPGAEHGQKIAAAKDKKASAGADDVHKQSLFRKATDLFARVPVLKALFIEILASQGVSTILNVAYVTKLSSVIPDDNERAGWSGKVSFVERMHGICLGIYLHVAFHTFSLFLIAVCIHDAFFSTRSSLLSSTWYRDSCSLRFCRRSCSLLSPVRSGESCPRSFLPLHPT